MPTCWSLMRTGPTRAATKVEQADILDNGTRSPSLLMKHGFTEGSRIVCLFNTGLGAFRQACSRCHHDGGTQYALPRHVVEYQPPRSGRQPGHTDVGGDELLVRGCLSGEAFGGEDHRRIYGGLREDSTPKELSWGPLPCAQVG